MPNVVGRTVEVEAIASLVDAAGVGSRALVVEGEPGIGKTTLWLDALDRARRLGVRVLAARASAAESVLGYATLADLLTDVEHATWADLPDPQRHGLASALLVERDPAGLAVDPRAVGAGLLAVVNRLAASGPVLVAIDDLQWIDASSRSALAFMARRLTRSVMLLGTVRSEQAGDTTWIQLGHPDAVSRIRLSPLNIHDLREMLAASIGVAVDRNALQRIHETSGGNPFYAIELARELEAGDSGAELRLPDSLLDAARARLGRVPTEAGDAMLAVASLATPTLRDVAAAIDIAPRRLIELLDGAESEGVIAIDGNHVRFTHPLLAHAVQADASAPRRRATHRRLAAVVTESELRARHLALSDPAGEPETLHALDAAAVTARARGAPAAAAELWQMAIELGGGTADRRLAMARCLFDSGDSRRARKVLEGIIADATSGALRAEARVELALAHLFDDSFHGVADLCRDALTDFVDDGPLRVEAMTILAFAELNTGQPAAALATAERAVAVAERFGARAPLSRALGMRAILRFFNGEAVSDHDLERSTAYEDAAARVPLPMRPSIQRALVSGYSGDVRNARDTLERVNRQCLARGEEGELMFIAFNCVLFDIWLGDLTRAERRVEELLAWSAHLEGPAKDFIILSVRAALATHRGRVAEARELIEAALEAGRDSGYTLMMSMAMSLRGLLELSLGEPAAALAAVEPLLPTVAMLPDFSDLPLAAFLPDAAEAMVATGRLDDAVPLIEALERNGSRLDRAWMLAVGTRCRAALLAARGDTEAAVAAARRALTHHDRLPMPLERARTLLLLGRLERRLRHVRPATDALTEALALFDELGNPLWSEQARAELARIRGRRPASTELSANERRVAELAASGMRNNDIATAMFLAPKTVDVYLTRIYRKLDVHSRIELFHAMNGAVPQKD